MAIEGRRKLIQGHVRAFSRLPPPSMAWRLLVIVYFLVARGWRAINWTFLTQPPMESMTKGGILPCIVGTLCLSLGAILVALPIGVASAIYLNEYARPGGWCASSGSGSITWPAFLLWSLAFWPGLFCGVSENGGEYPCRLLDPGGDDPAGHYRAPPKRPSGPFRTPTGRPPWAWEPPNGRPSTGWSCRRPCPVF